MALLCGSASVTFPSTSFPPHSHRTATTKSSFVGSQLPLPKLSLSPSSIRTHFPAPFRVRSQQDTSLVQEDPRFIFVEPEPRFKGPVQTLSSLPPPPPSFLLTGFVYFALFRYPESVVDGWFCWNSLGIHFWVSRSYHKGGKNFNFLLWKVSNCSALSTPLVWTHLLLVLLWRNGQVIEHCCLLIWNY